MHAPSVMNRFFTSHAWFHWFTTPSLGVRLIRAPPISWMQWPGGLFDPCVPNVRASRGVEHLGHRRHHVLVHRALVVAPADIDARGRDAPLVFHVGVERDAIVFVRKRLPPTRRGQRPRSEIVDQTIA